MRSGTVAPPRRFSIASSRSPLLPCFPALPLILVFAPLAFAVGAFRVDPAFCDFRDTDAFLPLAPARGFGLGRALVDPASTPSAQASRLASTSGAASPLRSHTVDF